MARTRNAGKPDSQQAEKPAKLTFAIPGDLARRFGVHAEMLGLSKSELFAEMIRTQCRRFVVHDHGKDAAPPAEPGAA